MPRGLLSASGACLATTEAARRPIPRSLLRINFDVPSACCGVVDSNAEPDFEEGDVFRLIVPMRPAGSTLAGGQRNSEVTEVTEKVTEVTEKVTEVTEKKIIELLKDNSKYKTGELAEILDISRKTVSAKLKK
ncbi:MAG: winged helix-turn-helix transcriptional regulator [Ruminococcus flavefaciens]|nr:winged helix-turn-helix transcriptional regulator [Ruminococcus flavefaciens]